MTAAPQISVVMPVLDEAARIETRLGELARLELHEVIVVDGGSRDATRALVAKNPRVTLVEAPRGRAAQMNAGASRATGDVLLFLHADVSLPADAVKLIKRTLDQPGIVAGAFWTWTVPDPTGPAPWWAPLLHLADLRSRYSALPYGDQALFVRRRAFEAVGGYPTVALMEDVDLSRALSAHGEICIVPARVRVSGRRFIERPIYYTALVNLFPLLYRLGVPAAKLAALYHNVRGPAGPPAR